MQAVKAGTLGHVAAGRIHADLNDAIRPGLKIVKPQHAADTTACSTFGSDQDEPGRLVELIRVLRTDVTALHHIIAAAVVRDDRDVDAGELERTCTV